MLSTHERKSSHPQLLLALRSEEALLGLLHAASLLQTLAHLNDSDSAFTLNFVSVLAQRQADKVSVDYGLDDVTDLCLLALALRLLASLQHDHDHENKV